MGKLDHILELTGPDTYFTWKHEVTYTLGIEDQWCHVTDTVDPKDVLGSASYKPVLTDPLLPTAAETTAIQEWLINDLKAKAIITHCLSILVQQLISTSHKVFARDAWKTLEDHFGCTDMGPQHVIHQNLYTLHMKDTADASNYVGQHSVLCERLLRMGTMYTDAEAVFQLLRGLPHSGTWPQFKVLMTITLPTITAPPITATTAGTAAAVTAPVVPAPSVFDICVSRISAEVARVIDERVLVGGAPGSEYANAATSSTSHSLSHSLGGNINSITGLHKHRHNPEGIFCMTVGCNKGDHDHAHCYAKGSGMEGQAPWMKHKKETAAIVVAPIPMPNTASPTIAAFAGIGRAADTFLMDLSCAVVSEIPDSTPADAVALLYLVASGFNTILNSGMTTMLIHDKSYFWSYSTADAVTVCTANHGSLSTSG